MCEPLLSEKMNYNGLLPSLERLALSRTAITLFSQDDIRTLLANSYIPILRNDRLKILKDEVIWQSIEDKVTGKVLQLPLPKCLKGKIIYLIRPIGFQILEWIEYHNNCYLNIDLPKELCWSPQGTVDGKKTAEMLIKDETVHVTSRYKLACIYCLEDDIQELWKKIPTCYKHLFFRKKGPGRVKQRHLVTFWTYWIRREVFKWINAIEYTSDGRLRTPYQYQYAFKCALIARNKVAAGYFLKKLTTERREACLVRLTSDLLERHNFLFRYSLLKQNFSDVACYLLSQMNEEEQLKIFTRHSFDVLCCILKWPYQEFFMETAKRVWIFLNEPCFIELLKEITRNAIDGHNDHNYQKLFGDFWQQSPINFKKHALQLNVIGPLLWKILQAEDTNVKLILNYASTSEREHILFCEDGKRICENLISIGKCDFMKLFVQECISSKNVLMKFKEEFKKQAFGFSEVGLAREKDMRRKLLQVIDDLIQKDDEQRGLVDGNSNPAKKRKLV